MTPLTRIEQRRQALETLIASRAAQYRRNAESTGEADAIRASVTWQAAGRELRVEPLIDAPWSRVVACLNIWQDTPALARTMATWAEDVDAVVIADGSYHGGGSGPSTDGLREAVEKTGLPATYVPMPGDAWPDQRAKRTALVQAAAAQYPGALLVILDADESLIGAERLRDAPEGDVLWLDVVSPIYERPYSQPRGVRAVPGLRYEGRHHWIYRGDTLLATHQYGGVGVEHRRLDVTIQNQRGLGHTSARAALKRRIRSVQYQQECAATTGAVSDRTLHAREVLRIMATTTYDAGLVGYRLHTAINTTTPHVSAFAAMGHRGAFNAPWQYDLSHPNAQLRLAALVSDADVLHCHLDYAPLRMLTTSKPARVVIHHHGSMYRKNPATANAVDPDFAGLRLVSNLEMTQYGDGLHFLPNPVAVRRYQRLREQVWAPHDGFRVAHSPSRRDYKGTDAFLAACATLQAKGVPIVPVLIEKVPHAESLRLKATCDAAFDSFWLGLQCSGLEAAAMGLPVVAGDSFVADAYRAWLGHVPYTFANDEAALVDALAALATDEVFRRDEAGRVHRYTVAYHDDAAVALRYLDLLDEAFNWRMQLKVAA